MLEVLLSPKMPVKQKQETLCGQFGMQVTSKQRKELYAMCNLSYGVEQEALLTVAKNLLQNTSLTVEEISANTGLPIELVIATKEVLANE